MDQSLKKNLKGFSAYKKITGMINAIQEVNSGMRNLCFIIDF